MAKLDPALLRWPSATDGPTFSRNDDFAAMRDALIVSRCFLVRGAIDGGAVNALRKSAEAAYSRWDRIAELPPADADRFLYGHIPIGELGCDRELETMVNVGYVRDLMRNVFGWDLPLKCPESYLLRRLMPPRLRSARVVPRVAFHQDEAFAISSDPGLTEQPQLCFTMWLPLCACGSDAPGLSVVPGSDIPIVKTKPPRGWGHYVCETYGTQSLWSPEMKPGDLLIFTSRAIHGSYVTWRMTKPRYSIEMRGGINL